MDLAEFERGKVLRGCGYTKTAPRKWTDSEIEYMKKLKEAGRSNAEIAAELGRSEVSISIKLKRLTKKENTYNIEPYKVTEQWDNFTKKQFNIL